MALTMALTVAVTVALLCCVVTVLVAVALALAVLQPHLSSPYNGGNAEPVESEQSRKTPPGTF